MDERTTKFNIMLSEELKKFSHEVRSKIYFEYDSGEQANKNKLTLNKIMQQVMSFAEQYK